MREKRWRRVKSSEGAEAVDEEYLVDPWVRVE
jgi:hypothetical protein